VVSLDDADLRIAKLPGMERAASVYLAKAQESLETAESELEYGRYNSSANRCYYACFQAAIAALLREGIRASGNQWGHDFVQARFNGELINRRKRYGVNLRQTLAENQELRDEADYGTESVTRIEVSRAFGKAQRFVDAVERESSKLR
jgi:uncharacterized protein (UPF0332 family)